MSVIKLIVVIIFSAYAGSVAGGAQFADPVDTGSVAQHLVNDRGIGDAIRDQLEEAIHSGRASTAPKRSTCRHCTH
jgi:hypothetical protein